MAMKPSDQEISDLYRESGAAEPSGELDRSILAAARAAVAVKPAPSPWWKRWRLPLQALASVAVVAMLVVMVDQKQPDAPVIGAIALNTQPAEMPVRAERAAAEKALPSVADKDSAMAERATVQSAPAAAPAARSLQSERVPAAAEAEMASRQASALAPAASLASPVRPPKEWLESIQVLIRQGRIEEAKTSLAAFERAYPTVVVPDVLRKQLK